MGLQLALEDLAAILLPPDLASKLPPNSEIVIVPHGFLGLIPFAALPVGDEQEPFGHRYAVRYSPSLKFLSEQDWGPATWTPGGDGGSLVVGNPAMPEVTTDRGRRVRLAPLPSSEAEGRAVAFFVEGALVTGTQATETMVRRALPHVGLIHLATHGLAYGTEARVRDSYVALAEDDEHDGLLTVGELLDDPSLNLKADLVVLSACQTGLGDLRQAEGTVGLQRAFLARGARSVLVSLWSVNDEATSKLMTRFYYHWLGSDDRVTKAEALRLAQYDVSVTTGFAHPRYWAAFQLVGNN